MYIRVTLGFETGPDGREELYDIGANVWPVGPGHWEVGEPDISAPDCDLDDAWATQATIGALPVGWSERFAEQVCNEADTHYDEASRPDWDD